MRLYRYLPFTLNDHILQRNCAYFRNKAFSAKPSSRYPFTKRASAGAQPFFIPFQTCFPARRLFFKYQIVFRNGDTYTVFFAPFKSLFLQPIYLISIFSFPHIDIFG